MIVLFIILILIVLVLLNNHIPLIGKRRLDSAAATLNINPLAIISENANPGHVDIDDNSRLVEFGSQSNPLLYDMQSPEPAAYQLVTKTLLPRPSKMDFSDWEGPTDGSDDGNDKLWKKYANWHTDQATYAKLAAYVAKACAVYSKSSGPDYLDPKLFNMISSTYRKMFRAIRDWSYKACQFPWGNDWYEFTISVPYYLILGIFHLYTVGKKHQEFVDELKVSFVEYVDKLYQSPVECLGWKRTGSQALLQGAPYIVAHFWKGDLEEVATTKDFEYMKQQCDVTMVVEGDGLRPDYGWLFNTSVRAYGHLESIINRANIINCFYKNSYGDMYAVLSKIMCHPTINANLPGLFSRSPEVYRQLGAGSFGIHIQYSGSIVNIKNKNYFMQFMGQQKHLAYHESDHTHDKGLALWMTARFMWIPNDVITQYDENKNIQYVPGNHTIHRAIVPLRSRTANADAKLPTDARSAAAIVSDTEVAFYNYYKVDNAEDSNGKAYTLFNGLSIKEMMFCDETSRTSTFVYINDNGDPSRFEGLEHVVETGVIKTKIDDKNYLLTNGKLITITAGNLEILEVEFNVGDGSNPTKTRTETHSVFMLTPVAFTKEEVGEGDLPTLENKFRRLAYRIAVPDNDMIPTPKPHSETLIVTSYDNMYWNVDDHLLIFPRELDLEISNLVYYVHKAAKVGTAARCDAKMSASLDNTLRFQHPLPSGMIMYPTLKGRDGKVKGVKLYHKDVDGGGPAFNNYDAYFLYHSGDYYFQVDCKVKVPDKIEHTSNEEKGYDHGVWGFEDVRKSLVPGVLVGSPEEEIDLQVQDLAAARVKYGTDKDPAADDWEPLEPFEKSISGSLSVLETRRPKVLSVGEVWEPLLDKSSVLVVEVSQSGNLYYRTPNENDLYGGALHKNLVRIKSLKNSGAGAQIIVCDKSLLARLRNDVLFKKRSGSTKGRAAKKQRV